MDINFEDIQITQYFYVLVKRIWLIILCFVLILVFTVYLTYRQTPIYKASATLMVTPSGNTMGSMDPMSMYTFSNSMGTQVHIIESDPVLNMIIDALNLEKRFSAKLGGNRMADRDQIVSWLRGTIEVVPMEGTQILTITASGEDPELITNIVNAACDQFIIHSLEGHIQTVRRTIQKHQEQLEELKMKVKKSKQAMIDFIDREKVTFFQGNTDVVSGGAAGVGSPLLDLRIKLEDLYYERNKLLQRYTAEHPKVKALQAQIDMLETRKTKEEENLAETNKSYIRYEILRAEADADEKLYQAFLQRLKEISIADTSNISNVQVLEYAKKPRSPVSPDKVKNYMLGLLFGLLGGVGMAFVMEYFDDAPKSASEIEAYIGLPIIATLPKLKRSKDRSIDLISAKHPKSTEAEVVRMLRTYVLFEKENPEDKVILVTSSGPKEGKSSICSNLAVSMAQANVRTLLIDADLRRPILHRLFNLEKEVGLTELLSGRSTLDRAIKKTDVKNLYVLTCGTKVSNPAELLNSPEMKKIMQKLRGIFGQIIMDTPPTGNLADTLVLSSLGDSSILVYSGELNKNLLLQTKRMMEKTGIKLYGIVLNNFDTTMKGYYYSYYNKYYNRYYQTYFHEESEEEQEVV